MTREEKKEHWADFINVVFWAEEAVRPTLKERVKALGKNPTKEQRRQMGWQYCLDIAEEILSHYSDAELKAEYGE